MVRTLKQFGIAAVLSCFSMQAFSEHVNEQCREVAAKTSCVDLAISISAVDTALDQAMTSFANLGALLDAVKASEQLFAQINQIFTSTALGHGFSTIDELYDAINKCGLVPHVIDEIND